MGEWYYIGHYGQLGPLTKDQMDELVEGGVIMPDTYVWRSGMTQWVAADTVPELRAALQASMPYAAPPPPPTFHEQRPQVAPPPRPQPMQSPSPPIAAYNRISTYQVDMSLAIRSDRSRTLAGILQILLPGVGRMYLGYYAYGTLQLVAAICTGFILHIWSIIDGIIILSGGVKFDGYGRVLGD